MCVFRSRLLLYFRLELSARSLFSLRIRSERLAWAAGLSARFTLAASTRRAFQRFPQLAPASSGQRGCYAACIVEPHETRFPPFRRCVLESNHAMLRKKRIFTRHFPVFSCRVVPESLTEAFRIRFPRLAQTTCCALLGYELANCGNPSCKFHNACPCCASM